MCHCHAAAAGLYGGGADVWLGAFVCDSGVSACLWMCGQMQQETLSSRGSAGFIWSGGGLYAIFCLCGSGDGVFLRIGCLLAAG